MDDTTMDDQLPRRTFSKPKLPSREDVAARLIERDPTIVSIEIDRNGEVVLTGGGEDVEALLDAVADAPPETPVDAAETELAEMRAALALALDDEATTEARAEMRDRLRGERVDAVRSTRTDGRR